MDKEAALANSNVLNGRRRWRILSEIIVVFGRCNAPCFDDGPPVTTASSSLPKRLTSLSTWSLVHPVFAVREDRQRRKKSRRHVSTSRDECLHTHCQPCMRNFPLLEDVPSPRCPPCLMKDIGRPVPDLLPPLPFNLSTRWH